MPYPREKLIATTKNNKLKPHEMRLAFESLESSRGTWNKSGLEKKLRQAAIFDFFILFEAKIPDFHAVWGDYYKAFEKLKNFLFGIRLDKSHDKRS